MKDLIKANKGKNYVGIKGWLAFFLIRVVFTLMGLTMTMFHASFSGEGISMSVAISMFLCLPLLGCVLLLTKKDIRFRLCYIAYALLSLIPMIPEPQTFMVFMVFESIWVLYLFRSKRVKATCVVDALAKG